MQSNKQKKRAKANRLKGAIRVQSGCNQGAIRVQKGATPKACKNTQKRAQGEPVPSAGWANQYQTVGRTSIKTGLGEPVLKNESPRARWANH